MIWFSLFLLLESVYESIHALHMDKIIFDPPTLMKVGFDVANGMNYLHKNKIVLGDLKPSNFFINKDDVS